MKEIIMHGSAHVFGNDINTDLISPACYMEKSREVIAAHVMEGCKPDFPKSIQKGDFIVAGHNFGSGSSRETAPLAIKDCGIAAVIAVFFARIFYRNGINIGLPVLICPEAEKIEQGDQLEVDIAKGVIKNLSKNCEYACDPLPPNIQRMIECGGLLESLDLKKFAQ